MDALKELAYRVKDEIDSIPLVTKDVYLNLFYDKDVVFVKGYFDTHRTRLVKNNWGDDINCYFFSEATGKKFYPYPDTNIARKINLPNYLLIGSTIAQYDLRNSIVWGAGLINDKQGYYIKSQPKKILAVRGPLTRKWLIEQGVECPEIFGDPAILLSQFYEPQPKKKHQIGLIPHYIDYNNPVVIKFSHDPNVQLIRVRGYQNWKDFIDQINECDFIISSSLHGLIVSESYGIPSIWAEFENGNYIRGWEFKFHDFYASIGKEEINYFKICNDTSIEELRNIAKSWKPGDINVEKLLETCPFDMHIIN